MGKEDYMGRENCLKQVRKEIDIAIESFRADTQKRLDEMANEFGIIPILRQDLTTGMGSLLPISSTITLEEIRLARGGQ